MAEATQAGLAAAVAAAMAAEETLVLLARLAELPCVSAVSTKPNPPANKANHFGVKFKLTIPGKGRMDKRSAMTEPDGARPTFAAAVRSAIETG